MAYSDRHSQSGLETSINTIDQARKKDPYAWDRLVHLYTPLIRFWCHSLGVRDHESIENVTQEVFMRVARHLGTFKKVDGQGSFRGWLRKITQNCVFSQDEGGEIVFGGSTWKERVDRCPSQYDRNPLDTMSSEQQCAETLILYRRVMNLIKGEFSPMHIAAFRGMVVDQRPARELALDLQTTANVIYQAKSRILKRVRGVFSDLSVG